MPIRSLSDVRVFRQIVASGSIAAAARTLGDNKNRISQRLVALEGALGARLADRTTRTFRLTDEGRRFYEASEELLLAAERAEASIAVNGPLEGRVRVSMYSSLINAGVGAEVAKLLRAAPKLELQIAVIDGEADLMKEGIDLAIQVSPLRDSSLIAKHLGDVPYAMAASPTYLEAHGVPSSPDDLAAHECIRRFGPEPEVHWALIDTDGNECSARLGGRLECSDARMQGDILYAGFGIGLRPAAEVRRAVEQGTLREVLPGFRLPSIPVWAVCPKGRLRLQRMAPVVELLQRAVEALR